MIVSPETNTIIGALFIMKTPLSITEIEMLSSCPIFEGMDRAQISDLLEHTQYTITDIPAGSEIPCSGMIILLHGKVLIEKPVLDVLPSTVRRMQWKPQVK